MRYSQHRAIIDIGSNSVRINIMGISDQGHFMLVDQAREKTRISAGMGEAKIIQPEAINRLIDTLRSFRQLMQVYQVSDVQALATAAIRQSKNQHEILRIVERETELVLDVLSEEEEAQLGFLGCVNSLNEQNALLVDLGGASTEFVLMRDRKLVRWGSIAYGAVTLSEKFVHDRQTAISFIQNLLQKIDWLKEAKGLPIIALGGTIRTLAKMDQIRRNWPLDNLHGYCVCPQNARKYLGEISRAVGARIYRFRGVSSSRADILRIGIVPFEVVLEMVKAPYIRISMQGIREGAFYKDYLNRNGLGAVLPDVAEFSGVNLQKRMGVNLSHAAYIEWLLLELYDLLEDEKDSRERELLRMAARLHDIGMGIGYYAHHQHGLYLTLHAGLVGFYEEERMFIALLIGLHRNRSLGRFSDPYRHWIGPEKMHRIERLALLLSLAERLDRTESATVKSVEVSENELRVKLKDAFRQNFLEISIERLRKPFYAKYKKEIILLR